MKVLFVVALSLLVAVASGMSICAGCPVKMDISEAETVLKTAEAKLATSGGRQYKFGTIHSATKQVIAGILYSINVDVFEADNSVETCNVEVIQQPWLDNTQVSVKCPMEKQVRMPGGVESMTTEEAESVLKETEAKLATLEDGNHFTFSKIHSATKQVVSGFLYKINVDVVDEVKNVETCDVEIWEQAWLGKTQVTFKCPNEQDIVETYHSKKARSTMPGGVEPMTSEEAESILKETEAKLATLEDGNHFTFSKIHSATKQVVAGFLYKINVDVVDEVKNVETCDVEIWEQAWLGKTQVTFKCPNEQDIVETYHSKKARSTMPGGVEPMDNEEAESVLKETEAKLATLEDGNHFTFSKIHFATKQVVAGILYSIKVDVVDEVKNVETCDVEIWEQAWLGKTQVTFKCPNEQDIVETYTSKN